MGDHGIDGHVPVGDCGRHRAATPPEVRPQASALLDVLAVVQSTLSDATRAGDRTGIREAVAGRVACWVALAELADEVHPAYALACRRLAALEGESLPEEESHVRTPGTSGGRHSAACHPIGVRPWAVTPGRHAAQRRAPRQPAAATGRHWAEDARGAHAVDAHAVGGGVRRMSMAAVLERALAHETPISALRPAPTPSDRAAAVGTVVLQAEPEAAESRAVEQCTARERKGPEQWTAPEGPEPWMPTQRGAGSEMYRPVDWHPVPRPRHSSDDRPINPAVPDVA